MDLQSYCLFCLEKIVPYKMPSRKEDERDKSLTFQTVCKYLKITFPKEEGNKKISDPTVLSVTCEKFLCLGCFEMVEESKRLYGEMEDVQRKIEDVMGRMKEVIAKHDINKKRRGRRRGGGHPCSSAFVGMFQALVKEVNDGKCEDDVGASKPILHMGEATEVHPDTVKVEVEVSEGSHNEEQESLNDILGISVDHALNEPMDYFDECLDDDLHKSKHEMEDEDEEEWRPPDTGKSTSTPRKAPAKRKSVSINRATPSRKCKRSRTEPVRKQLRPKRTNRNRFTEDADRLLKCPECDLSFFTNNLLWKHRRTVHPQAVQTMEKILALFPLEFEYTPKTNSTVGATIKSNNRVCLLCSDRVKETSETNIIQLMEHMLSHEDDTPPDLPGPHKCTECDMEFRLKLNLEIHKGCIHEARQFVIECEYCPEYTIFQSREDLIEHLKCEHGETVYSCKNCSMSYISLEKLLTHMDYKHRRSKRLYCPLPLCSVVTTSVRKLNQHCAKEHSELKELFSCNLCGKSDLLSKVDLRHHKAREHNNEDSNNPEEKFVCFVCNNGKVYQTKLRLDSHIQIQHGDAKKFHCDRCEKRFPSRPQLKEHIEKDHENRMHVCTICGNKYKGLQYLNTHMKTHTGEGVACQFCGKLFYANNRLNAHLRTHKSVEPEDKVVCDECGKECENRYKLYNHKQNVHPKKFAICSVCGWKFKKPDQLKTHMRTHTGERPFTCTVCQKGFNRRDIMRVHVKGVHGVEYSEIEKQEKID